MLKKLLPPIKEEVDPPKNEYRQSIKREIERLFTEYSSYPSKLRSLASELADYIAYYLSDDECMDNRISGNYGNTIKDKICKISNVYTPLDKNLPIKGALIEEGKVLASGQNGRIYSNIFDRENIVTKAPLTWDIDYLIENFISYRIINTILANNILVNNLLPSYSLFTCTTNLPETKVDPSFSLKICSKSLKNKHPVLFITQKQLFGDTLVNYLERNELTFDDIQYYIREIAVALISLEESPYQISHNDLHGGNIIIEGRSEYSKGHPVIIDWGHGRFTNPKTRQRYQSFIYNDYQKSIFASRLKIPHTGAYDFFFLIMSIMFSTRRERNPEETKIITFLEQKAKSLIETNFTNSYGKPVVFDYNQFYLLRFLEEQERHSIEAHKSNLKKLGELTYRKLFSEWLTDEDNSILSDNKTRLNSPDFFKIESDVQSDVSLSGLKLHDSSSEEASSSEEHSSEEHSSEQASSSQEASSSEELSVRQNAPKSREKICSYSNRDLTISCHIPAEIGSEFCYYHNQKRLIDEMKDNPEKTCSDISCAKKAKIGSEFCGLHLFKKVIEEKDEVHTGTSSSEEEPSAKKPPVRKICLCINTVTKLRCVNEAEKDSEFCYLHKNYCKNIYGSKNSAKRPEKICSFYNKSVTTQCQKRAKKDSEYCEYHDKLVQKAMSKLSPSDEEEPSAEPASAAAPSGKPVFSKESRSTATSSKESRSTATSSKKTTSRASSSKPPSVKAPLAKAPSVKPPLAKAPSVKAPLAKAPSVKQSSSKDSKSTASSSRAPSAKQSKTKSSFTKRL